MIEVPAAALMADVLAREADFLSVGTNDLIQYMLAVDRTNENVAHLYQPLHPAILRTMAHLVRAAATAGVHLEVCGEMAADPLCTLVLLGLGLDDLSMQPFFIPVVKRIVRSVSFKEVRALARDVLALPTVEEVKGHLFDGMRSLGIIELLSFIDNKFGVSLPPDEVVPENFRSINSLTALIQTKLA